MFIKYKITVFLFTYSFFLINFAGMKILITGATGFIGSFIVEEALNRGVKVTGATVHFVDSGTDTGPIILQKAVSIEQDDTPESLQLRVMQQAEWKLLPEAVRLFSEGKLNVEGKICRITAGNE